MDKAFEVKEFDVITYNPDYADTYKFLEKKRFDALASFIRDFTGSEENSDANAFVRLYTKKNVGDVVSIRNYVGLIQMKDGFQIEILPKIDLSEDKSNLSTKRIFLRMIRCIKDFPGKSINEASLKVDRMNLYELFISMYLQEVRRFLKHGLKSSYVTQESNLYYFKGKLLLNEDIKSNALHKERFFMSFDEFHPNRPENKLLKATLLKLSKLTSSSENAKAIRQMLAGFELVEASTNYEKDFASVSINRMTKDYENLIQWSKVFLFNKSFTTFSGEAKSRALLFPMESVYESYVAKQITQAFLPLGWNVSAQDKGFYLFEEPQKRFALRPDIVLKQDNRTIIMDTKWKNLVNNQDLNYGISQEDMYQMYAYSKKYKAKDVWLLYPLNNSMRDHKKIVYDSGDETTVSVFFIDLEHMDESMTELKVRVCNE